MSRRAAPVASLAALAAAAFAALAACAATPRPPATRVTLAADAERERAADRRVRDSVVARLARAAAARGDRTVDLLLLSGGGQHGAYGVGFLRGWRARPAGAPGGPPMPRFDLVTGVSTGALQAPFAFLGTAAALDTLSALYRGAASDYGPTFDPWFLVRRTGGVVDTRRYEAKIARTVDARLRDSLAAGLRAGRQLLVATTDFDLGTGRMWDLAEPLGVGDDAGLARARDLLYTSTAIPGIFPPRALDGHVHADGGVVANTLMPLAFDDFRALGARLDALRRAGRLVDPSPAARPVTVRVWAVVNVWTHAPVEVVPASRRTRVGRRSTSILFFAAVPQFLERQADLAARVSAEVPGVRVEFRYTAVPAAFATEPGADKLFDGAWMRRLEAYGEARARGAAPWDSVPPSPYARPAPPAGGAALGP